MFNWKLLSGVAVTSLITTAVVAPAYAQVTTSGIRGVVSTDNETPIDGASVTVTHVPSGTVSQATTNDQGVFNMRGLRVGGPYKVNVSGDFTPIEVNNIYVDLDETYRLDLVVSDERMRETIIVTATPTTDGYLDTGLRSNLGMEQLGEIVSIDRDIADAAQTDPFASVNIQSGGPKELSIAGANNRYNSLTVDGVALNDRFGLNANGYPTQRSPIPYLSIQSLSIETAPYDTEFNGFTGGSINAVTRSGENEFHGSLGYYFTNDGIAGSGYRDVDVDQDFDVKAYDFTIGGPILKDRLFFFGAYEKTEEATTLNSGPQGSGALNVKDVTQAEIDRIRSIVKNVWQFDPGGFSKNPVQEEKYLLSLDWNMSVDHRAKFTWIHNEGSAIVEQDGNSFLEDRRVSLLGFSSSWYNRSEKIDSYIGHVFSNWTPRFSTEFKIAYTKQDTGQNSLNGSDFPLFTIRISETERGADANDDGDTEDLIANVSLGPDTFRHGNELSQEFMQYKAKAEYVLGNHTFKAGFEREEVDVNNLFAPSAEGQYFFNSIADLENRQAAELFYENAASNNENDRRAIWGYAYNSLYLQDTWDINSQISLQYGIRYDTYESKGTIRNNARFAKRYGYANTGDIGGLSVVLPRFSFTYEVSDNLRVRGGIGRFSGGSPNVWVSNIYSNDGTIATSTSLDDVTVPATPDAASGNYIPKAALDALSGASPDGSVNALAPGFKIPLTQKANIGAAWQIREWTLTADILYNKLENAPYWFDQSCVSVSTAPDGRPVYDCGQDADNDGKRDPEAIVLSSTSKGDSLLYAVSASREWETLAGTFDMFASYTHSDVKDIGMGTSSTATSNYSDTARYDYQVPRVGTSGFQVEHLFKMRLNWKKDFFRDYETKVSLHATRRSGQPYSYTFATDGRNDAFGIRENRADDAGSLFYVPSGPGDPLFSPDSFGGDAAQQKAFFDYITNSELAQYRGGIAARNGDDSRWQTLVNLRFQQELPGLRDDHRTILFVDLENVGNMLNKNWGIVERVRYEYKQQVAEATIVNGQYVYDDLDTTLSKEVLSHSIWSAQFGIRYKF